MQWFSAVSFSNSSSITSDPSILSSLCRMATASASEWLQQDERRMLHAVYRVGDMVRALQLRKSQLR